jgi:glycosyltransferase involved in cell wall biosynthesis
VVLVGMQQEHFSMPDLPSNVHVLGPRPYNELPAYVQAFDVALIPYVLNQHTVSVDPLKLLEYLASGRPVVSTPLPEVEKYAEQVTIGDSNESFIAAVCGLAGRSESAVASDAQRRMAFASGHTWQDRASTFLSFVARAEEARARLGGVGSE